MGLACRAGENRRFHVNSRLKHYILKDYLSAWLPILSSNHGVLSYVDCFAGAGSADFGNASAEGSPLVALRVINEFLQNPHPNVHKPSAVNVSFVEKDATIHRLLSEAIKNVPLDPRIHVLTECGDASDFLARRLSVGVSPSSPEFLFVDPDYELPDMTVVRQYVMRPKTEVFLNFMFCEVVRNMANALDNDNMIALFGDSGYQTTDFSTGSDHYAWDKVIDFYAMRTGAQYYIPFRVCFGPDENAGLRGRLKYVLIHLSNHFTAFDTMLTAMYDNSEPGNSLQVSMKQPTLFPTLDYNHLIGRVKAKYWGTGVKKSFDALREENWRLYASEQMWRRCLKALRTEGVVVSHHVTSKTDVGLRQDDIVEFPRG